MADAETLARQGAQEMQQNRLDQAEQTFTAAIKAAPKRADTYHMRARCRGSLGDLEGAIADAHVACKLGTDRAEYHFMLARLLLETGDDSSAGAAYRSVIAACERDRARIDQDAGALSMWGDACIATGDYKGAIPVLSRAIEIDAMCGVAFSTRGNAYGYLGDHDNALRDWRRAIEINPRYKAMLESNIATAIQEQEKTKLPPPHVDYEGRIIVVTLIVMGQRDQIASLWSDLATHFAERSWSDNSNIVLHMGEIRGFQVIVVLKPFDEHLRASMEFLRSCQGMLQIDVTQPQPERSLEIIQKLTKEALLMIHGDRKP